MVQKIKSSNLDADILTGNAELAEAANNADTVLVHDTSAGSLKKIQVSNLTAQAGAGLSKSSSTLAVDINGTTALNEGAATGDFVLIFDSSAGALKKITQNNLLNFPTVSSVSPTNLTSGDGTGNYTIVITGAGFTAATASLVNNSGAVINFDSQTVDSATQITGVIAKSSLDGANEPFDVRVAAASGLQSTLENQINIDQQPVWQTAAGSLATIAHGARTGASVTVAAHDPESGGEVTYTLESGTLPGGMSLTSTSSGAVISGDADAVGSNTTSTFTLRAKDVNSNTSDRQYTITISAPVQQSFTSSGTFSVPSGVSAVDVLVVAGGGAGGIDNAGGGGAGGLIFRPGFTVTPGGTVSVTVGNGGTGPGPGPAQGAHNPGQDSAFGTLTAKGGGGGVNGGAGSNGTPGGSGSGATRYSSTGGTGIQPTQPGDSGNFGFGNPGGQTTSPNPGPAAGGGGGGAGGAGAQGGSGGAGNGGVGKQYNIADGSTNVYYAGGGGGGWQNPGTASNGGQGGGGDGATPSDQTPGGTDGGPGTANRGGGGGGGSSGGGETGGSGGKGVVIVSF